MDIKQTSYREVIHATLILPQRKPMQCGRKMAKCDHSYCVAKNNIFLFTSLHTYNFSLERWPQTTESWVPYGAFINKQNRGTQHILNLITPQTITLHYTIAQPC